MKRVLLVGLLLVAGAAYADFFKRGLASTVRVTRVEITPLPDGGCSATAFASFEVDGGSVGSELVYDRSRTVELSGANRTLGLDILDAGSTLFKTDKGL